MESLTHYGGVYLAFSCFCSLSIILIITFVVTKKHLHLFEIMFIWMCAMIIDHNVMTVVTLNLGMYQFTDSPSDYLALTLVRIVILPLLIVWYFDITSVKAYQKWIWLPAGIAVLIGVEYLSDVLGVFERTRWNLWWSVIEWFVVFVVLNYAWLWYRNMLRRERG
ncbi:hypothetical protein N007_15115 [Alicyclobacillus acidoterrestris ATCC 49025]|nr:hypothetical protein N007_15115 [Alicyclobacillus acidoterrestris ATCC 49025]